MNLTVDSRFSRVVAALLGVLTLMFIAGLQPAAAHNDNGYSHDSDIGYTNKDWITNLPDDMLLSHMSIPGTHDTMAYQLDLLDLGLCTIAANFVFAQSMNLTTQLNSGIRLLDIRARHVEDGFEIYHGDCYVNADFDDVLQAVTDFLYTNKDEFVLMKIKEEGSPIDGIGTFDDVLAAYLANPAYAPYFWENTNSVTNPTVEEIRGKIVLTNRTPGLELADSVDQECDGEPFNGNCWKFSAQSDQYAKWENVKAQLNAADSGNLNILYKNPLNGADSNYNPLTIVYPYFVASGHKNPDTDALREITGHTTLLTPNKWPDFPRTDCLLGICTISYEGMNILTKDYIRDGNVSQRVGWIWMDFPGSGLIDEIIQLNYAFVPLATADAGGPYLVNEGEQITFDASASSAANGAPLKYLWDYIESDPWVWELPYVYDATVNYTWYDDHEGTLTVAVTEDTSAGDSRIVYDTADIVVKNVAPTVETIDVDQASIDEGGTVTVSGTFSDPALGVSTETFTGQALWSDGATTAVTVGAGTFSTSRTFADDDPTGTASDDLTVDITISDDDGGDSLPSTSPTITVYNVDPSVTGYVIIDEISENGWVTIFGTISDPGLPDAFALVVDWDDGSPVTYNYAAGTTSFQEEHRYLDDNPSATNIDTYTINVTVYDDDGGSWTTSSDATVANIAPELALTSGPFTIDENGTVTLTGTIVDPSSQDTFELDVDWGDGGPPITYSYGAGTTAFSEQHQYLDDNPTATFADDYIISVTLTDDDLGQDTARTSARVRNVEPQLAISGSVINENGTATVSGTITDPGTQDTFEVVIDWGEGSPVTYNYGAGTTTFSEQHQYLDDDPTATASDVYSIRAVIEDDDLGKGVANTKVTVNNVAPLLVLSSAIVDENGTATVNGAITDPGTRDTFEVIIDWGEGDQVTYNYAAGTTAFSEQHQYLDDNPTATASDIYKVSAKITDDDLGQGTANTTVTVNNVNPITVIDAVTDETGEEVATNLRLLLVYTQVDLSASFSDVGTQDTHVAAISWGDGSSDDLGATTGSIATAHIYTLPGDYLVTLEVTDDDTGVGSASASITVADATGAITELVMQMEALAADPALDQAARRALSDALAQLEGQNGGSAASGALDLLAQGNLNAALVKMWQAMQSLEAAEEADASLDLTSIKSLLALSAKSTAMTAIVAADAAATGQSDSRKVQEAYNLIDEADDLLATLNYVEAVDTYRKAAQKVQGINN